MASHGDGERGLETNGVRRGQAPNGGSSRSRRVVSEVVVAAEALVLADSGLIATHGQCCVLAMGTEFVAVRLETRPVESNPVLITHSKGKLYATHCTHFSSPSLAKSPRCERGAVDDVAGAGPTSMGRFTKYSNQSSVWWRRKFRGHL